MSDAAKYDSWLTTDDFAALVIREHLIPVEGPDGVLFPATYAAAEDKKVFPGGYNIDPPEGDKNVCLVDSVGSQANRIEPIFAKPDYAKLVPQVTVKAGEKSVGLLEAGHRAGDALVRCTSLQKDLQDAFKAVLRGNAEPMAKIAPTSLVFGVWDSRDTQAKLPRLVASTIRAFDVTRLTRSANYLVQQQVDYIRDGIVPDWADITDAEKKELSKKGYQNALATASHGGVIANGGVRRDATLSLAALRLLSAGTDKEKTLALRRYVLGLSLVAFTATASTYLRQGCNLVPDIDKPREFTLIHSDGSRETPKLTHADALQFALSAAQAFGVGEDREVKFEPERAKKDIAGEGDTKAAVKAAAKKAAAEAKKAAKAAAESTPIPSPPAGDQ
jgi:CRISPR-associated protein Csb1